MKPDETAIDNRARRAAKRCGWYAKKSRTRNLHINDHGKFMIIEPNTNTVVAGAKFNLPAKVVIEFCRQAELRWEAQRKKQKQ